MLSAVWTLCFEMPFMTLDGFFSGRQPKPWQHAKHYGSVESRNDTYRSREKPTIADDKNNTFVNYSVTESAREKCTKENRQDGTEHDVNVNGETEGNPGQIYAISSYKNTWKTVSADNGYLA